MKYFDELKKSMSYLAKTKKTIFIGQAVEYPGTAITNTLKEIPKKKLYELPVSEEMQMGISIGLVMQNFVPISIYPRLNFLILSMNQLVNHLDKLNQMTKNKFKSKVIIRTSIGSERPLHPQYQHVGDFTSALKEMCPSLNVVRLDETKDIFKSYKKAIDPNFNKSSIIIEYGDYYNEK